MTGSTAADGYDLGDEAIQDLVDVVESYNADRPGLGEELCDLVFEKLAHAIVPWPRMHGRHPREPSKHIYRLDRFPIRIIYDVVENIVYVVAVEHSRAEPDKWRGRLIAPDDDQ